jgi:hypothetical protein
MIEPGAWHSEGKCPSLPPLITALQTGSSSPCQHPGGVSCQTLAFRNRRIWIISPWIYNSWAINAIQDVQWVEVSKTRSRSMDVTAVHSHKTALYCSGRWGVDCRLVVAMGWDCRLSTAALGLLYYPRVTDVNQWLDQWYQPGVREDTLRFSFLSFKTYYLIHYFGCNLFYLF